MDEKKYGRFGKMAEDDEDKLNTQEKKGFEQLLQAISMEARFQAILEQIDELSKIDTELAANLKKDLLKKLDMWASSLEYSPLDDNQDGFKQKRWQDDPDSPKWHDFKESINKIMSATELDLQHFLDPTRIRP